MTQSPETHAGATTPDPELAPPYVPPPSTAPAKEVIPLSWVNPLRWLRAGWLDLMAAKGIALFYGLCFWAMAWLLGAVFHARPEYTLTLVSGCFLVGPFLAMGLYQVSLRREQGKVPELSDSLTCWERHVGSMALLVLVLMVLELLWGRASLVVFAVFFDTGMPSSADVLRVVLQPDNWVFLSVFMGVGALFAGLVYLFSVVAIPMILDRDTDAISAAITSAQVVLSHPGVMSLWGALISILLLLALQAWGVGLLVIGPWLGHASWHAYRGTVRWLDQPAVLIQEK